MKKLNLLYALLFVAAIVSCSKDEDEKPSFKKEDFMATWEDKSSENGGCTDIIKFDATQHFGGERCNGQNDLMDGINYTFDGKQTISYSEMGFQFKYVILSLSSTTLKLDAYLNGTKLATVTYTKI